MIGKYKLISHNLYWRYSIHTDSSQDLSFSLNYIVKHMAMTWLVLPSLWSLSLWEPIGDLVLARILVNKCKKKFISKLVNTCMIVMIFPTSSSDNSPALLDRGMSAFLRTILEVWKLQRQHNVEPQLSLYTVVCLRHSLLNQVFTHEARICLMAFIAIPALGGSIH